MTNNASALVERLRNTLAIPYYAYGDNAAACEAFQRLREAADIIESLQAERDRYAALLDELIANDNHFAPDHDGDDAAAVLTYHDIIARAKELRK